MRASDESFAFALSIGDDERRGPEPDERPGSVKRRLHQRLTELRADGLSDSAEHAVDTYLTVADAFEADGQLVQAVDCLRDVADQLDQLAAARSGARSPLVNADADLLPYRDRHNVHVVDDRYLTGAQPTERGYRWLREQGVTTVISLRLDAEADRRVVESLGLRYFHVAWADEKCPTVAQIREVLAAIDDSPGRVFQHCLRGIGRDLTMAGCYQVATGLAVEQIVAEARRAAPRWETDQDLDPVSGEPVQFAMLRSFAAQLTAAGAAPPPRD